MFFCEVYRHGKTASRERYRHGVSVAEHTASGVSRFAGRDCKERAVFFPTFLQKGVPAGPEARGHPLAVKSGVSVDEFVVVVHHVQRPGGDVDGVVAGAFEVPDGE